MKAQIHTPQTAPEAAKPMLEGIQKKMGMIPNILAMMAEAPNVLKGYLDISAAASNGTFSPVEVQVIQMTSNRLNGCGYCMAAHSTLNEKTVPAPLMQALRNGTPLADPKLEALRQFSAKMVEARGQVTPADIAAFMAAGYTKGQVAEVVLSVAAKVLTNYFNSAFETPIDQAFEAQRVQNLKKAG